MEIEFATTNLRDVCETEKMMKRKFGNSCAIKLKTRIADFQAATYVSELTCGRPHPLKYGRLGQFSVSISGALRLIFECGNNPIPRTTEGSVDWDKVTTIKIISIEDYHE